MVFCCWLLIDSHRWPHIYISHWSSPWSSVVVTGILLPNIPLIFEKNPCTCTPQLIDSWYILNYPGLFLLIVNGFTLLILYLLLPPTRYLVFCCRHWSSTIKYSSGFRNISLRLHSTIDRPLINHQLPWFSYVNCRLIHTSDPVSITCSHRPGTWYAYVSLVFCFRIILLFSKNFLAFAFHDW